MSCYVSNYVIRLRISIVASKSGGRQCMPLQLTLCTSRGPQINYQNEVSYHFYQVCSLLKCIHRGGLKKSQNTLLALVHATVWRFLDTLTRVLDLKLLAELMIRVVPVAPQDFWRLYLFLGISLGWRAIRSPTPDMQT